MGRGDWQVYKLQTKDHILLNVQYVKNWSQLWEHDLWWWFSQGPACAASTLSVVLILYFPVSLWNEHFRRGIHFLVILYISYLGGAFLEYNFSLEVWHEFIGMNYLEGLCWTSRSGCSFLWQHCPWCWLFSTLHHRCPWDWLLSFPCQRCPWCWFFSFSFHWDKPCPWCWSNLHCLPKMSTVHGTETVASVSFWHGRCPWCWSNQLSLCLWAGWCLLSVCYVSDIDNVSLKKYSHKSSIF